MLNRNSLLSFLIAILSFLLASCYEETNLVQSNALEKKFYKKLATKIDSNIVYVDSVRFEMEYAFGDPRNLAAEADMVIEPQAQLCGTKTTYGWGVDHFEPMAGKLVGIWPVNYHSPSYLLEYKNKWGYSGLFIGADSYEYNEALQVGYLPANLMISIHNQTAVNDNYAEKVDNFYAGRYYIGEPVDHQCDGNEDTGKRMYKPTELIPIKTYISSKRPNSVFVLDGYKRCDHLQVAGTIADKVMFSSYHHWINLGTGYCITNMGWGPSIETYYINGDSDQRPDWSEMKNIFGPRFTATWVSAQESEFGDLFGHASNLGLNEVWIYMGEAYPPEKFEAISLAAWNSRFLRRFDRKYRIEWRCDNPDPCRNCDPTNGDDGWYVVSSTPTYEVKEVIR
jgi:hypothetical protein